jgi:two-component system, LytTR family, sensor kinase
LGKQTTRTRLFGNGVEIVNFAGSRRRIQSAKLKGKDLPIFILIIEKLKKLLDIKRFKFYLWIGLAYLLLMLFAELTQNHDAYGERILNNIWGVFYVTVINYILFEYSLTRLKWKDYGKSILLILGHLILYSGGLLIWTKIGIKIGLFTDPVVFPNPEHVSTDQMTFSMASVFFFGIIRHIYNHIKLRQSTQQLRIEKQQAELNYLKSQTNPHFLFNTLNNIYSLARDKSDLAPESIMRLSKILRYMLYETGGSYIAIEQDLKIISDYIELEKLRYDDSLRINFNYDIEDMKQALTPLLLMPLVENAFKYGASETRNQPFVDIHLSVNKRQLAFFVNNSTDDNQAETSVRENIGLSNLRRQLELLYTDYHLSVEQQGPVFKATLKINLASHV